MIECAVNSYKNKVMGINLVQQKTKSKTVVIFRIFGICNLVKTFNTF